MNRILVVRCPAWSVGGPGGSPPWAGTADQPAGPKAREFEPVITTVQEFCPRIEVLRPGICAFSASGPAGYFGGEAVLAEKINAAVAELGLRCGVGVGDGLFAALLASQDALAADASEHAVLIVSAGTTPAFLAPRSVTILGEPDLADLLMRLGIRTLGEFAALPAAEVSTRFGPPGVAAHRLARGLDPRPLVTRPPAQDLSAQTEFDPPADRAEQVVFAAKTLATQMHARLASKGLACVRVQVLLTCADGRESTRLWRHDGLLSDLAVAERVRWQLDGWQAAGAEGASDGLTLLRLVPDQVARDRGRQLGLWGDAVISDRVARAAIRVQAMLGHDAVRQPVLSGGRDPADQALLLPFGDAEGGFAAGGFAAGGPDRRPVDRPWPGRVPPPAPATVYPMPRSASVTDGGGAPVTVTGRGEVSAEPARLSVDGWPAVAVTAWTGPWPVTERWWDPVRTCRKARFQLVTVDGSAWLAFVQDGRWLIEASYD